jgi:polysaccharide biosynthesis/export protein
MRLSNPQSINMHKQSSLLLLISIVLLSSCVSNKKVLQRSLYFREVKDSLLNLSIAKFEQKFKPGDMIYIGVITPHEGSSKLFNQPNFASGAAGEGGAPMGYLVENDGHIIFPVLGKIGVVGYNKQQLTDTLTTKLRHYIDSPIVSIRLLNYKVTVLGEVNKPGTYSIPNERVTVLDAIGLAGDMTLFGVRDSVVVVRNNNDKVEIGTLNINSGKIFNSPYFYLQQNDIVYVEMNKRKITSSDQVTIRTISLGLAVVSTLTIILTAFR